MTETRARARGGTLILIRRNFPHYNLPTPPLQHIEATIVVLTPPNFNPISIASVYVPPKSDERLFTLDFEQLLQTNSNCVIFGDLNATHNEWNCLVNSTRGKQLKTFTDTLNLTIAYPSSPTRFGHGTSNTLDIAVINNFNFPSLWIPFRSFPPTITQYSLIFPFTSPIHQDNARAVTTCCSSGPACSDDQKANLLAITLKDNFTENERPNGDYPIDNTITTTLENFFSHPPPLPITPTDPDEVLNYIKTLSNNKAPALLVMDLVILNPAQVTWTTPELSPNFHSTPKEERLSLGEYLTGIGILYTSGLQPHVRGSNTTGPHKKR
ncbi:RNA-directed DNA polymerase from mobile element jockey [Trichonephila clavipes]|nr:RNA-directed DNA polymerase from mobile element jockey [Trichonephila clavipes]